MMGRSSGTGFSCNKGEEGEKRMVHKPVFEITSLLEQLNDRILSIDSLQGLLVFLLCALIIFKLAGEVRKMLRWFIFLILFMEIGHAAAQTELGQSIPWMGQIFKYNMLQSVAQLFKGTPICTALLYMQQFLNETIGQAFPIIWVWVTDIIPKYCMWLFHGITHMGGH